MIDELHDFWGSFQSYTKNNTNLLDSEFDEHYHWFPTFISLGKKIS